MSYITYESKDWRFDVYDTSTTNNYWLDYDPNSDIPELLKPCINDEKTDQIIDKIMEPFKDIASSTHVIDDYKKLAERCVELNVDPFEIFKGNKYNMFLNYWLYNYRTDLLPNIIELVDDNKLI